MYTPLVYIQSVFYMFRPSWSIIMEFLVVLNVSIVLEANDTYIDKSVRRIKCKMI